MAIYTVGRRRVILALLLTGALLLTLDVRGNRFLDRARDAFSVVMEPVEDATEVVTNPIQRVWNAYDNYDDLERENEALREQVDRLIGTQAAAEASVIDYNELLALNNLPSLAGIDTEKAQVVGATSNNIDQIVEINKGSLNGIAIGMPVVNQAGLIGRITSVQPTSSKVMLITDSRFSVAVEIVAGTGELDDGATVDTTPSGLTEDEIEAEVDAATSTTLADGEAGEDGSVPESTTALDVLDDGVELPQFTPTTLVPELAATETTTTTTLPPAIPADGSAIVVDTTTTTTTTTTTLPPAVEKEFGALEGRGQGRLPQIRFLQDNPSLAELRVGDLVETAGGADSLSPPDIPVGQVVNRADRPGVAGPILEIELWADLDQLNFVRVVLYRPLSEVDQ